MIKLGGLVKQPTDNKKNNALRESFERRKSQIKLDIYKMILASKVVDKSAGKKLDDLLNKITEYIMYKQIDNI